VPREYRTYTEGQRLLILATAIAEGLSATDVHQRFGVKPVTYYSWRQKAGLKSSRGQRPHRQSAESSSTNASSPESGTLAIIDPGAS